MSSNISSDLRVIQERVQTTFDKIYYGEISQLQCPYCLEIPLRFSYTFVQPNHYRIWLSCTLCKREAHLRLNGKPPGYNEDYVISEFQKRDEKTIKQVEEWWRKVSNN